MVEPFSIPLAWPRAFGMAIQPNGVAALWGARDEGGTIYLYAEHQLSHAEPSENARAIKELGSWIPGVISAASLKGSQAARNSVAQIYRLAGLNINVPHDGEEADVYRLLQLMAANRIRVFASLGGFLAAYRTGAPEALLLLSCQALILSSAFLFPRTVPKDRAHWDWDMPRRGPLAWMARNSPRCDQTRLPNATSAA